MAENTVCEGDVVAPAGVVLADCALVEGDVYTDGTVEFGPGARIEGRIRPTRQVEATPDGAPATGNQDASTAHRAPPPEVTDRSVPGPSMVRAQDLASPRSGTELERSALGSTFRLMLALAEEHGIETDDDRVWGLDSDALDDLLDGTLGLVSDVYLEALPEPPWPRDLLAKVLFGLAFANVAPVTVEHVGRETARLRVGRPDPSRDSENWPERAASLVRRLGQAARPELDVELEAPGGSDPDEIGLELRF